MKLNERQIRHKYFLLSLRPKQMRYPRNLGSLVLQIKPRPCVIVC